MMSSLNTVNLDEDRINQSSTKGNYSNRKTRPGMKKTRRKDSNNHRSNIGLGDKYKSIHNYVFLPLMIFYLAAAMLFFGLFFFWDEDMVQVAPSSLNTINVLTHFSLRSSEQDLIHHGMLNRTNTTKIDSLLITEFTLPTLNPSKMPDAEETGDIYVTVDEKLMQNETVYEDLFV